MIHIQKLSPHTFEVAMAGQVGNADMAELEDVLAPYLDDEGAVDVVFDLTQLEDGLAAEAGRLSAQADKLGRLALVIPEDAVGAEWRAIGRLMPRGQFQRFDPNDKHRAQEFVLR